MRKSVRGAAHPDDVFVTFTVGGKPAGECVYADFDRAERVSAATSDTHGRRAQLYAACKQRLQDTPTKRFRDCVSGRQFKALIEKYKATAS